MVHEGRRRRAAASRRRRLPEATQMVAPRRVSCVRLDQGGRLAGNLVVEPADSEGCATYAHGREHSLDELVAGWNTHRLLQRPLWKSGHLRRNRARREGPAVDGRYSV